MLSSIDHVQLLFEISQTAQIYVRFRDAFYFMQNRPMRVVAFIVKGKEKDCKVQKCSFEKGLSNWSSKSRIQKIANYIKIHLLFYLSFFQEHCVSLLLKNNGISSYLYLH